MLPLKWKPILRASPSDNNIAKEKLGTENNSGKLTEQDKIHFAFVAAWLVFTVVAFAYLVQDKVVSFDSEQKLQYVSNKQLSRAILQFTQSHPKVLLESKPPVALKSSIVHFSAPGCSCQQYSEQHIEAINSLASEYQIDVVHVELEAHDMIPSTPSVAIVDNLGDIVYFGPYGQGLYCTQTSGYAQTILNNLVKGYVANLIVKQAKGCYCQMPLVS